MMQRGIRSVMCGIAGLAMLALVGFCLLLGFSEHR
jgi:hypothetical protein